MKPQETANEYKVRRRRATDLNMIDAALSHLQEARFCLTCISAELKEIQSILKLVESMVRRAETARKRQR